MIVLTTIKYLYCQSYIYQLIHGTLFFSFLQTQSEVHLLQHLPKKHLQRICQQYVDVEFLFCILPSNISTLNLTYINFFMETLFFFLFFLQNTVLKLKHFKLMMLYFIKEVVHTGEFLSFNLLFLADFGYTIKYLL